MSIIWSDITGWILCHSSFLKNTFSQISLNSLCENCGKYRIFHINSQFTRPGQKTNVDSNEESFVQTRETDARLEEILRVKNSFEKIVRESKSQGVNFFNSSCPSSGHNNAFAVNAACNVYQQTEFTQFSRDFHGYNQNTHPITITFENEKYLVPESCEFYNCNIELLLSKLSVSVCRLQFDIVVLDPPWWNKHIRRKNATCSTEGYSVARDREFMNLPVNTLLSAEGLVAVWCTNSQQQSKFLIGTLFPAWKVDYIATWYWVKVTENCEPICKFSNRTDRKQPFERIVFAGRRDRQKKYRNPEPNKLIISVPSSVHSHKPPLKNVLIDYAPINPRCIELFARYLVPGWISCGNEVLKLQHESLFI